MKKIFLYCLAMFFLVSCDDGKYPIPEVEKNEFNTIFSFIREYRVYPVFSYDVDIRIYKSETTISSRNNIMSNWHEGWTSKIKDTINIETLDNNTDYKYQIVVSAKEGQSWTNYHSKVFCSDTLKFNSKSDTLVFISYPSDTLTLLKRIF